MRWSKVQTKLILVVWLDCRLSSETADVRRRAVIDGKNAGVEASHRSESSGLRNLVHRQSRFVDQFFGKMQAPRLGHCDGRRPEMTDEEPAKMARPYSETLGQIFNPAILEAAFADQAQSARNRIGRSLPGGCSGATFRPTAEA